MPCFILNEETRLLTQEAIASLGEVNLIIIDNASTMGGGYLRSVADIYVRNKYNLGYAKAVNQGLLLSKSDYVAIANNDVRVSPNWQEVVTEVFTNSKVYSVHPRMIDYDAPFEYGTQIVETGKERWCTGSFFVINKRCFPEGALLYDEGFFNSYDDWDYFMTVRKRGKFTAYTDKACYQHHHSFTQKQITDREKNNKDNQEYFKMKHGRYAEEIFAELYPDQMGIPYPKGFEL